MRTRRWCLAAALGVLPGTAAAQGLIHYSSGAGEIGGELRAARRAAPGGIPLQDHSYQQWLRIPLNGTVFLPQFLTYSLVMRPVFGRQAMLDGAVTMRTRDLGVDYSAQLLSGRPLSLTAFGSRTGGGVHGTARGENIHSATSVGTHLRFRNPWMPMSIQWLSRGMTDAWRPLPTVPAMLRNEQMKTLRLEAQSSKTVVAAERVRFTDRIGALSFTSLGATAQHTAWWGKGSSVMTTGEWGRREGSDPHRRAELSEQVHLQHTRTTSTDMMVSVRAARTGARAAHGTIVGITTTAQPRPWLRTNVRASSQSDRYGLERVRWHSLLPRADITGRVFGATVGGMVSGMYEHQARGASGAGIRTSIGERHLVDDARVVTLREQFVEPRSITVQNTDGTLRYVEDLDYRLVAAGPSMRLYPLPGGRIVPGDVLEVTYDYRTIGALAVDRYGGSMDITIARGPFDFSYGETWHGARGTGAITPDQLPAAAERASRVGVHGTVRGVRVDGDVRHRSRERFGGRVTSYEARGGALTNPTAAVQLSLTGNASRTLVDHKPLDVAMATATIGWTAVRSLRLQASAEQWSWRSTTGPRERALGGSLDVDWRIGRLEALFRYGIQERKQRNGGGEHRVSLRVVRRL